jgi:formylglycine-generating enzyme required for sulfatase activity
LHPCCVTYHKDGFCYKLSRLAGGDKKFRLPTEFEWEVAARGGHKTNKYIYSGSDSINDVAWWCGNSYDLGSDNPGYGTHAVGTKQANELGIYDMSGNVWEWCSDWYDSTYPSSSGNPTGAASGSYRVVRGGCWDNGAAGCRVSFRSNDRPSFRYNFVGFRLVVAP